MTVDDTREMLALRDRIKNLSPPDRLLLAASLIQNGKLTLAEWVAGGVVDELRLLRILGKVKEKGSE